MKALFFAIALVSGAAQAQGFDDAPTCFAWSGGHKSSGSFSKCNPDLNAAYIKPPVVTPQPVVVTPVPAPAPVVTQIIQAPAQSCAPPAPTKPIVRTKPRKPRPAVSC